MVGWCAVLAIVAPDERLAAFVRFAYSMRWGSCVLFYVERLKLWPDGLRRAGADSQTLKALEPFRLALERGFVGY